MTSGGGPRWRERLQRSCPAKAEVTLMEVCGTHTMTARRAGIHDLLPDGVRLLSGPGCPVCVSPVGFIDHAVALARTPGVIVASYGDLLRVPGSTASLELARSEGGDVRVVYSAIDALELARKQADKTVVFLGVGFETTAPTTAAAVVEAAEQELDNFTVLSAHRLVPPALETLLARPDDEAEGGESFRIDAFLAPGHVSAIIGVEPYQFIATEHGRPVVVTGFAAEEMLLGIEWSLRQVNTGSATVENAYPGVVRAEGNPTARAMMKRVFEPVASEFRGLGVIPASGLGLRTEFARHDAAQRIDVTLEPPREPPGCQCGLILRGELTPEGCPLFGETCTPDRPVGACMVSSEGACAAAFRFQKVM